jgi:hypothetical protein
MITILLNRGIRNGCYHWGDVKIPYHDLCSRNWAKSSSAFRIPAIPIQKDAHITREWLDLYLALRVVVSNAGNCSIPIGSLGFPAGVSMIFTSRRAPEIY